MASYLTLEDALAANYPFAALPVPDGEGWEIVFPDIAGVVGFSETWEGIGEEARSILRDWLEASAEEGNPLPAPSCDWDPITREPEDFRLPVLASTQDIAKDLGVSVRRVRALAHARGVGQMIGNSLAFTPQDIEVLRERREPGRPSNPKHASALTSAS
jgi:predicted RNase H-like HicB family nuclease